MAQHLLSRRGVDAFGGEGGGEGVPLDGRDETEVLALGAALERRSEHPLAHAILTAAEKADLP
jgi:hypothetical protein